MNFAVPLLALGYSGVVLFWLAHALRQLVSPIRAAIYAFLLSATVHSLTLLTLGDEYRLVALAFWGVPHVLLLPLLLLSAKRANRD